MTEISGVVQEITTRSVAGGKTAYNLVIGGQSYGAGLYAPKANVGDFVTFELDDSRGYKNVAPRTLRASAHKPATTGSPAPPAAASYSKPAASNSFDTRQDAISRQAASNTAIGFMELLAKVEALPLGKTKRQEAMETLLHKYEQMFYERNTGNVWKDISPNPAKDEDAAPEAEDEVSYDGKWE